jgi:hypothetical protein
MRGGRRYDVRQEEGCSHVDESGYLAPLGSLSLFDVYLVRTYVVFERELGVTSNMVSQLSFPRSREAQPLPQTLGLSSHLNFIRFAISRINNHLDSSTKL